jgi:hypothetical protein
MGFQNPPPSPEIINNIMILWHLSPTKNRKKILTQGLTPKRDKRGIYADDPDEERIYFFVDLDTADDALANWLGDIYEEESVDYYEVNVDLARLFPDDELAGSFYTKRMIGPENIKLFKTEE